MADVAGLPNDIEELKRLVALRTTERDAAKAGLLLKTLEAEKLKTQIARLKRMSFGASSERVRRELEQLELKLEEIETAEAQAEAAAGPAAAAAQAARGAATPGYRPRTRPHLSSLRRRHAQRT